MNDLISRLQAATGPSRELDAEVCPYPVKRNERPDILKGGDWIYEVPDHGGRAWNYVPRYTESIDLVLRDLVPKLDKAEGALWLRLGQTAGARGSGREAWNAEIWGVKNDKEVKWWGIHTSPAIALLIAIEQMKEDSKP